MDDNRAVFGVDVAKATCVVARYDTAGVASIANGVRGIAAWLASIPAGSIVAMEATGAYHKVLAATAHAAGMRVFVFNPYALKHYARGIGQRGKTDPVDAHMIARYTKHELPKLIEWQPPSAGSDTLSQLLQR